MQYPFGFLAKMHSLAFVHTCDNYANDCFPGATYNLFVSFFQLVFKADICTKEYYTPELKDRDVYLQPSNM